MFDIVLVLLAASAAVGGYRLGFVARAASWFGLVIGLLIGALLLPRVAPEVQDAGQLTVTLVAVGLLVGTALIGQSLGQVLGSRLHAELPAGAARRTDQVGRRGLRRHRRAGRAVAAAADPRPRAGDPGRARRAARPSHRR